MGRPRGAIVAPAEHIKSKCLRCGYEGDRFAKTRPSRCLDCLAVDQRKYRKQAKVRDNSHAVLKDRSYALRTRYGMELEDYDRMLEAQGGGCAVCGSTVPHKAGVRALHVDHNHDTGKVRGLLCNGCNRALGFLQDNPERAERLAAYLRETDG